MPEDFIHHVPAGILKVRKLFHRSQVIKPGIPFPAPYVFP